MDTKNTGGSRVLVSVGYGGPMGSVGYRGPGGPPGLCGTPGSHGDAALLEQMFKPRPNSVLLLPTSRVEAKGTSSLSFLRNPLWPTLFSCVHC